MKQISEELYNKILQVRTYANTPCTELPQEIWDKYNESPYIFEDWYTDILDDILVENGYKPEWLEDDDEDEDEDEDE